MQRFVHIAVSLLVLLSIASTVSAQGRGGATGASGGTGATGAATPTTGAPSGTGQNIATFDHLNSKGDESKTLRVKHGETFKVVINETCEDAFAYEVRGFLREAKPAGTARVSGGGKPKLAPKELTIVYDSKYGGYFVTVTRTVTATEPCEGSEKLQPRTFVIVTPLEDWDLAFSGAFTVSSLSSKVYYLRPHPDDATKKQVQEDVDKADAANLGIGAFVHLYHQRLPWVAGAFGLGIREGNKMEYFLGGGLRASDKATINAGVVFGPVNRLPNGVDTTRPVSDDNVLNDLPTRIQRGFFVSISYSFIDVRNKFQAPFAGSQPGTPAAPAPSGDAGNQAANNAANCTVTFDPAVPIDFAPAGDKKTVTLKTSPPGCAWKLAEKPGWLHVRTSGGTDAESGAGETPLSLEADANDTPNDRPAASVKIGNGSLPVTQKKKS